MSSPRRTLALLASTVIAACGSLPADRGPARPAHASSGRAPRSSIIDSAPIAVGPDTVSVMGAGESTFTRLRALIDGGRRTVHLEMYEFGRADLAQALIAAHRRAVEVTVIVDPSVAVTVATAAVLRAAGIDVLDYPVRSRMIDHVKLLVVDGTTAVVGGINWGATSHRNHDFDVAATGPVVADLDRVFLRDLVTAGRTVPVPDAVPDAGIVVAATGPAPGIRPLALRLLDGAQRSIDMEQFVLTDTGAVHELAAARARGVAVRVLLDPDQRPSDHAAADLRDHGVDVRLYRGGGEKLHAKAAVADRRTVLFGSANWTSSGFGHNHEVDLEIESPAVAARFEAQMEADWAASAPTG